MTMNQFNAISGHFAHTHSRHAKKYTFTLPEKYRENLENVKVAYVPNRYNEKRGIPFLVDEWLRLDDDEYQQHKAILGMHRPNKQKHND